jgi:anti-sigma regulatory factor (Ser/Thr protein kinase)
MVQRQKEYDADLRQLASMRAFLREVCQEGRPAAPADENLLTRLALALTEAASNIILHAYEGQEPQPISLTVEAGDDRVCVTLRHTGKSFDPQTAEAPAFDGSRESGFGLYLIAKCVDEVRYWQDDQGRCFVHLVQKRNSRHKGEGHGEPG